MQMICNNSFSPIKSICSIIETYFSLERKPRSRQKNPQQINKELIFILNKAIDLSNNPKFTLIQLGIIIFPGSIAYRRDLLSKLLLLCKSSLESRLTNAGWNSSNIYCISIVQRCLKKIVKNDYRNWRLKSIPKGSDFELFINEHPEIIHEKDTILTPEEFFSSIYSSQMSSPVPHEESF